MIQFEERRGGWTQAIRERRTARIHFSGGKFDCEPTELREAKRKEAKTEVIASRGGVMHDKILMEVQKLRPARRGHSLTCVLRKAMRQETHNRRLVFVSFLALPGMGVNAERARRSGFF